MKAFPTVTTNNEGNEVHCGGMDLRDYFAAQALNGIMSSYSYPEDTDPMLFSNHVYRIADAMMKAREQ